MHHSFEVNTLFWSSAPFKGWRVSRLSILYGKKGVGWGVHWMHARTGRSNVAAWVWISILLLCCTFEKWKKYREEISLMQCFVIVIFIVVMHPPHITSPHPFEAHRHSHTHCSATNNPCTSVFPMAKRGKRGGRYESDNWVHVVDLHMQIQNHVESVVPKFMHYTTTPFCTHALPFTRNTYEYIHTYFWEKRNDVSIHIEGLITDWLSLVTLGYVQQFTWNTHSV